MVFVFRFDTPPFMKKKKEMVKLREVMAKIYIPSAV